MKSPQSTFAALKQNISNHMSLSFESEGFSPLVGKIFAYLLFAPRPVSLQEMADELGVTKAAISVQVRTLEKHMMCQKIPISNDRRDYYYISDDISMTSMQSSIQKMKRIQQQVEHTLHIFDHLEQVGEQEQDSHDACKRRFIEMQAMYEIFLNRLEGLEEEWIQKRAQIFPQSE
ncbi:MarR family transcriptional regulator [Paenibacillus sp. H1-7]|uniref:GbsR/MarR family transcriptional regulator n=1 Tax=Paenibacillus sp. H1-7 TaxID=2282849 RepID=UPI001EF93146|nr:MarR family transcriptional regulator [Paenibacillus sp. H1-7]ULL17530.1 MarR family transcriptional regulator [Paenibacillus sp. H1-7]